MTREELITENGRLTGLASELESKLAAAITACNEDKAAHLAALAEATAKVEAGNAERDKLQTLLTDTNKELADAKAMVEEKQGEIAKLTAALANPAHMDATIKPATVTGGITDAEADELDRKAKEGQPKQFANIREEYESMPPGAERQAFWKAHKTEILDCE